MHRVTGVEKKWQKRLKRDFPKNHQKNTSAELVKHWMQLRQVSKLQNDDLLVLSVDPAVGSAIDSLCLLSLFKVSLCMNII